MKVKKSIIDQLVKEELTAMFKQGLINEMDWSRFKQQVARGFAETGDKDAWYAKFVRGIGLSGEQKAALKALDDFVRALERIGGTKTGSAASGGQSATKELISSMGADDVLSIEGLHQIAEKLRADMTVMFSRMDGGAPGAAGGGEAPSEAPESYEVDTGDDISESLRRRIRRKLRRFTF